MLEKLDKDDIFYIYNEMKNHPYKYSNEVINEFFNIIKKNGWYKEYLKKYIKKGR